jgi:hypothetical protein
MGLRPTHGDESALLTPIDSKRVMRDFRRSAMTNVSPLSKYFNAEGIGQNKAKALRPRR